MKSQLITLSVAGALTLGAFALHAQGPGPGGHHDHHMMANPLEHLTKELNLTTEQQAKVTPIVDQTKPQIAAIHQEAMQKMRAVMENATTQIRPLLTPEQQQKFDAIRKAHEDMMKAMQEMHEAQKQ